MNESPIINTDATEASAQNELALEFDLAGSLVAVVNGQRTVVHVHRCFPWSAPDVHLSLRDHQENEVAHVATLDDLPEASRAIIQQALASSGFVFEITAIESIVEELEIRQWKTTTSQGPRVFQTKLDEWPRQLPGSGWLIRDVAGDAYRIPHLTELDARTCNLLWPFVDPDIFEGAKHAKR